MRVGDYVRTKNKIYKIINKKFDETILVDLFQTDTDGYLMKNDIIKSSPNIIDLIEVGDYVNGHKVFDDMRVDTDDYGNDFIEIGIEIDNMLNHYIREEDIKSIVTKEQFETMKYKLEVKDE